MDKRFEDDEEFIKFLDDEYTKEAELIEAEYLSDDNLEEEMSDEEVKLSYERLKKRLIDDGVYRFERDAKKTRNIPIVRRAYPLSRVAAVLIISAICVLASSLSSETNRQAFMDKIEVVRNSP